MTQENYITFVRRSRGMTDAVASDSSEIGFLPSVRNLLEDHDRRYHPHGYKPGQKCSYRQALKQLTDEDSFDPAQVSEPAQQKLDESEDKEDKVKTPEEQKPDPVSEWLPKMRDEIFSKVGSLFKGATVKEDSDGIGYVVGPSVKNDEAGIAQVQAIVDAARAEYGLDKEGVRMAHYDHASPYVNGRPRIVFPYYKKGDAAKEADISKK